MTGIFIGILFVLVVVEFAFIMSMNNRIRRQKQRYDHLLRGNNTDVNLEELLVSINERIENSNKEIRTIDQRAIEAKDTTMGAVSNMAVVNFDAFDGQTGSLSFSLCLLDNFHNGIILTSLYSHEGSTVYLKEIVNGASEKDLATNELEALNKAKS
ncbi:MULTISPECIES: DUF4446 family protein [Anaerococcus]|uniref:DUF4446 family protein n=1 Tax=Anaerococcus TaxID=165779 RepID=UPI0027B9A8EF|nr:MULTISPECIES: DUF4446 family protein [Anaerococcus]MDU2558901.1 DUF4446 family protein [Anaerococcus prevotii]MDU3136047.1 DUF4446 family protein [Anaerococcus prevotii]